MSIIKKKTAIILFNFDISQYPNLSQDFLYKISHSKLYFLPKFLQIFLSKLVSIVYVNKIRKISKYLNNQSTNNHNIEIFTENLLKKLSFDGKNEFRVFIARKYLHKIDYKFLSDLKDFFPDELLVMSDNIHTSNYLDYDIEAITESINNPKLNVRKIDNFFLEEKFLKLQLDLIEEKISNIFKKKHNFNLIFFTDNLHNRLFHLNKEYYENVKKNADTLSDILSEKYGKINHKICFEKILINDKWNFNKLESELRRAKFEKNKIILVPISFVFDNYFVGVKIDKIINNLAIKNNTPLVRTDLINVNSDFEDFIINIIYENN